MDKGVFQVFIKAKILISKKGTMMNPIAYLYIGTKNNCYKRAL